MKSRLFSAVPLKELKGSIDRARRPGGRFGETSGNGNAGFPGGFRAGERVGEIVSSRCGPRRFQTPARMMTFGIGRGWEEARLVRPRDRGSLENRGRYRT